MPAAAVRWTDPRPLDALRGADLRRPGAVFAHGGHLYATTGQDLGHGGMGNAFAMVRRPLAAAEPGGAVGEPCVGKVFHGEYLYQLRTDEVTQLDYTMVLRHAPDLGRLAHPNLLPLLVSAPLSDNYLTVTPRMAGTLRHALSVHDVPPRRRVELLLDALRGLAHLHRAGFVHRDVTLRNILVDDALSRATLFDFDLTLALSEVAGATYLGHYKGRIFGSPGYSVAPEVVDEVLMRRAIGPALDLYAVGGSLFALFADQLPYGEAEDLWSLLVRIGEGVVFDGASRIAYPPTVPPVLRPIVERCLERDPDARPAAVDEVIGALEAALPELDRSEAPRRLSTRPLGRDPLERLRAVHAAAGDPTLAIEAIARIDDALAYHGYQIERALGRVKGHPIFLVAPRPEAVGDGTFPGTDHPYPKVVTAFALAGRADRAELVERWQAGYLPLLRAARSGLLTSLDRVVWDAERELLLLFSEYVDGARFGRELDDHELTLRETFGLGYLVGCQVRVLHRRGLAHNNVCGGSLLLKGVARSREVHPAMVGMVAPSFDAGDMATDVRQLAGLVLSWLRPARIAELAVELRGRVAAVEAALDALSRAPAPRIDDLLAAVVDGLAALDGNVAVLRDHGGDLEAHALLVVGPSLYGRLWD